jgi:hypothetical protein
MYFCVVSYCSTTAKGKNPFAVQLNNNNNNNNSIQFIYVQNLTATGQLQS